MRHNAITAPCVFDGPVNGASFLAYVEQCLTLALLDAIGFVAALSIAISLYNVTWGAIVLRLLQFDLSETMRLAVRAVQLSIFWSVAQEALRFALPAKLGPFLGTLLLALALARLVRNSYLN